MKVQKMKKIVFKSATITKIVNGKTLSLDSTTKTKPTIKGQEFSNGNCGVQCTFQNKASKKIMRS